MRERRRGGGGGGRKQLGVAETISQSGTELGKVYLVENLKLLVFADDAS